MEMKTLGIAFLALATLNAGPSMRCPAGLHLGAPPFVACFLKPAMGEPEPPSLWDDLIHYWTFDEGEGQTRANSVGETEWTEAGGMDGVPDTPGKNGDAAMWNSGNPATLELSIGFAEFGSSLTFAFWVNVDTDQPGYFFQGNSLGDIGIRMNGVGSVVFDNSEDGDLASTALSTDAWHLIVITLSGTTYKFYVDGSLIDTDIVSSSETGTGLSFGGEFFDGAIDAPMTWDRVLSADDVSDLWAAGAGDFPP